MTITGARVVFQGTKQAREWNFDKLLGYQHDPNAPWTAIQVSNRQKTSGILYDEKTAQTFRWRLQLALAHHRDGVSALIEGLERELEQHRMNELPAPPDRRATSLDEESGKAIQPET